jgi:hypothetical protein
MWQWLGAAGVAVPDASLPEGQVDNGNLYSEKMSLSLMDMKLCIYLVTGVHVYIMARLLSRPNSATKDKIHLCSPIPNMHAIRDPFEVHYPMEGDLGTTVSSWIKIIDCSSHSRRTHPRPLASTKSTGLL